MQTPIETAAETMRDLARLYRAGDIKPAAIVVTPEQFDALCDVTERALSMRATLRFLLAYHDNETPDDVYLEHVIADARAVLTSGKELA